MKWKIADIDIGRQQKAIKKTENIEIFVGVFLINILTRCFRVIFIRNTILADRRKIGQAYKYLYASLYFRANDIISCY